LDIKARDQAGRIVNIEVQLLLPQHFKSRILYYWAGMFREQLREGESYAKLRPTYSICLVNQVLFPNVSDYLLKFELTDRHGQRFSDLIAVHVLQLPRFQRSLAELRHALDEWMYVLCHAQTLDAAKLPAPLDKPQYTKMMKECEMLTQDEQDRERYESRMKAIRDQITLVEEAEERGIEKGIEKGMEKGMEKGQLIGRIHAYQRLLGRDLTPSDDLVQLDLDELRHRGQELEAEALKT
jgi:predicted transposase/invertase (TIGR01784 family)